MELRLNKEDTEKYFKIKYSKKNTFTIPEELKVFMLAGMPYFVAGFLFLLAGLFMSQYYSEPASYEYTWNGILMFMAICAGIGWVFHGTGFLLVRR